MNKILFSNLVIGLLFLIACKPQPEAAVLLKQAESIVETHPDSAMRLIDSLYYPEKSLKRESYMRFLVIRVQAKYKTYHPINEDTLVFRARDYFSKNNKDSRITALAWFYSGCVHRERKEYSEAMLHYRKAGEYAELKGDFVLQGLVRYNTGDLFAEQGLHNEALTHYLAAAQLNASEPGKQTRCFSAVGRMYTILQQPDSASRYFHKGLEMAEAASDTASQELLAQNLSVAYSHTEQFDKAKKYLWYSYLLNKDSTKLPRYYLNFAELYTGIGQQDSAAIYTELLQKSIYSAKDDNFKVSAYSYLAGWKKAREDYSAAFAYQDARMKVLSRIMEERNNQLVYEIHRKYDYEKMKKQYYMDITVKQLWIISLLTLFIGSGSFITWYWIRQRNRRFEAQRNIETLQELNSELKSSISQKQLDLRKNLLWRLKISRKILLLNNDLKNPERVKYNDIQMIAIINKIVFEKKDSNLIWDTFLEAINEIQPGIIEKITGKYPNLTEQEFRICILVYSGFNLNESALILNLSPNTIQTRRSDIRRKMGLDTRGDIAAHIDQL